MSKNDPVNHPSHYADHYEHEVIELTEKLDFCLGNAVKYILRAPYKGHEAEDLKKARWYLKRVAETKQCPVVKLDPKDVELINSYKSPLVKEVLWAFLSTVPANMAQTLVKLDTAILEAENRELKKELQEAKDQAFRKTLKQLAEVTPNGTVFHNLISTKYWMAGYAI